MSRGVSDGRGASESLVQNKSKSIQDIKRSRAVWLIRLGRARNDGVPLPEAYLSDRLASVDLRETTYRRSACRAGIGCSLLRAVSRSIQRVAMADTDAARLSERRNDRVPSARRPTRPRTKSHQRSILHEATAGCGKWHDGQCGGLGGKIYTHCNVLVLIRWLGLATREGLDGKDGEEAPSGDWSMQWLVVAYGVSRTWLYFISTPWHTIFDSMPLQM